MPLDASPEPFPYAGQMPASHHDRVEAAFTQQAGTFERADLNVAFTSGLPWLVELADPSETDRVLDVAGGTGLVARALAELVDSVTAGRSARSRSRIRAAACTRDRGPPPARWPGPGRRWWR